MSRPISQFGYWSKHHPLGLGICTLILSIFLFDLQGVIIKFTGDRYNVQQIALLRNILGIVPTLIALHYSERWHDSGKRMRVSNWPLALSRGFMIAGAQLCFYFSIVQMELATATTLAFAGPLFITLLSIPLLGHTVGIWRSVAVLIGFLGVVMVMRPDIGGFSPIMLLPLGAAFFYALASVTSRYFDSSVPTALINIYSSAGAVLIMLIVVTTNDSWQSVPFGIDWLLFACMGMTGGCAVLLLITSYRMADPSSLSPFEYFGIPFSFTLGWLFFNETPFERIFPGALFIIAGGLLVLWRERKLKANSQT